MYQTTRQICNYNISLHMSRMGWAGKKPRVIHYSNSLFMFAQVFGIALHEVYMEVQLRHYIYDVSLHYCNFCGHLQLVFKVR